MRPVSLHRQCGAVIVTVALTLLFLLGFMGIALDFGHLFVVKSELQTAMDSCALAAAQELDGNVDALQRARNAGRTISNINRVNFQSANWSGAGQLVDADITFRNAAYVETTDPVQAKYVQCQHSQAGIRMWLLRTMRAFSGASPAYADTQNVLASAVATRGSTQTSCPIPVAVKIGAGSSPPNYGLQVGQWITVWGSRTPGTGEFGWYNLDGSTNANETKNELSSAYCNTSVGSVLGTPGAQTSADVPWNQRFGIYKNNDSPAQSRPDFSGYSYTSTNWKNAPPQNAWSGTPAPGSHATAQNFITKRAAFAPYDNAGTSVNNGDTITGLNMKGGYKSVATPAEHQQYGYNRRVALVPVIGEANNVADFLCMFMLAPMDGPQANAQLEYLGNAGSPSSPCTTSGLPGGTAGPLVPVLVR
jgi:hypothetical protein